MKIQNNYFRNSTCDGAP